VLIKERCKGNLPRNKTHKHHRSVRSILKVLVPLLAELRSQGSDIFFRRSELGGDINRVPAKDRILRVDQFLTLVRVAKDAVDSLVWLEIGLERVKNKLVVLVLMANTGQLKLDFNTGLLENLRVTDTRSLKDGRCTEGTT
jgi:hypothetical protein